MVSPENPLEEDELEDEDEDSGYDYLEVYNGSLIIFDLPSFVEATEARALQVTDDGAVYIINKDGKLEEIPLVKSRRNLNSVK